MLLAAQVSPSTKFGLAGHTGPQQVSWPRAQNAKPQHRTLGAQRARRSWHIANDINLDPSGIRAQELNLPTTATGHPLFGEVPA